MWVCVYTWPVCSHCYDTVWRRTECDYSIWRGPTPTAFVHPLRIRVQSDPIIARHQRLVTVDRWSPSADSRAHCPATENRRPWGKRAAGTLSIRFGQYTTEQYCFEHFKLNYYYFVYEPYQLVGIERRHRAYSSWISLIFSFYVDRSKSMRSNIFKTVMFLTNEPMRTDDNGKTSVR